uniref:Uncharacterized protein n=1 Tax=Panagrolaimus sp. ES5 TaxID=591445 RepID=A0AC34G2I2_9BILA
MKTALTLEVILKVWPKFVDEFDDSWKNMEEDKNKEIEVITIDDDDDDEDDTSEIKPQVEQEPRDEKPIIPFRKPKMEQEDENGNEMVTSSSSNMMQRPVKVEIPTEMETETQMELEEGEIVSSPDVNVMNPCVFALVFIRAIALAQKRLEKDKVEQICKLFDITTTMVFSDEVLDYAGAKIGNVEILVAIAEFWANPGIALSTLFQKVGKMSPPPPHPSKLLLELGFEVEKFVDPSTVFNRTYAKKDLVDNSDRQMVVYDGDYIEGSPSENVQNGSSLSKQ